MRPGVAGLQFIEVKIFAISVIKNEADIIRQSLLAASVWADKIFVYDNGSTDGTWEIVRALASEKIVPWKQEAQPFREGLRGDVFRAFRHLAAPGDWWCFRLDADEFYIDDPREFLPTVSRLHQVVEADVYQFCLTPEDVAEPDGGGKAPALVSQLQYYQQEVWREFSFFRHRRRLRWEVEALLPRFAGVLSPRRIRVRHYQYRSLQQLQTRVQTRRQARTAGFAGWDHAADPDVWHYVCPRADLLKDNGDNQWPVLKSTNQHRQQKYAYLLKLLLHGLRILP